jgi:hypothetical protein
MTHIGVYEKHENSFCSDDDGDEDDDDDDDDDVERKMNFLDSAL